MEPILSVFRHQTVHPWISYRDYVTHTLTWNLSSLFSVIRQFISGFPTEIMLHRHREEFNISFLLCFQSSDSSCLDFLQRLCYTHINMEPILSVFRHQTVHPWISYRDYVTHTLTWNLSSLFSVIRQFISGFPTEIMLHRHREEFNISFLLCFQSSDSSCLDFLQRLCYTHINMEPILSVFRHQTVHPWISYRDYVTQTLTWRRTQHFLSSLFSVIKHFIPGFPTEIMLHRH